MTGRVRNRALYLLVLALSFGCGQSGSNGSAENRGPVRATPQELRTDDTENEHPYEPLPAKDGKVLVGGATERSAVARLRRAGRTADVSPSPVWFGLLHAHSFASDGSGTPEQAFARADSIAGIDFLAVTPHNHRLAESLARGVRRDGVMIATMPDLYDADTDVTVTRNWSIDDQDFSESVTTPSVIAAATDASTNGFVGIYGQEFSSISRGNHVNVLGWGSVLTVESGEFRELYDLFGDVVAQGAAVPVAQINHPDIHRDLFYRGSKDSVIAKMFNDLGFDDYNEDFSELVAAADQFLVLVEILTGPAFATEARGSVRYDAHENDYYYYLIQGFHISPSVGHDNHFETWGNATAARMGVFATELTQASLFSAMRANRTFASEDSDLTIEFLINNEPMGSAISVAEGEILNIVLQVDDPTSPGESYVAELIYGDIDQQDRASLEKWVAKDGLTESWSFDGDGELLFDQYLASGNPEFFYVRVTQGDDDRAWSAPVWINHPRSYDVE